MTEKKEAPRNFSTLKAPMPSLFRLRRVLELTPHLQQPSATDVPIEVIARAFVARVLLDSGHEAVRDLATLGCKDESLRPELRLAIQDEAKRLEASF